MVSVSAATVETLWTEGSLADDLLRMMFACCVPELAPESQIALILKTLGGLEDLETSVVEIRAVLSM